MVKVLVTLLTLLGLYGLALSGPKSKTRSLRRPNIIFILVDDMDKELGSPDVMKKTQQLLRQEGADFVNAFVTTPICCPSRTSILTGKYAHNHHTNTNNWNCSSPSWRKGPEKKTYARYLESAGYVTGHFGKYLNEYDGTWVPVGWKKWEGLVHNSKFYNYTLRHNTYKERHRMSYEHDYFTDLITNRSISFIKRTKAAKPDTPFLVVLSHSAPHGPETAAPQYSTAFPDAKAPRLPNWNFVSLDKQWILREKKPMDAQKMAFVDLLHRRRLQTLLSVDDSVEKIFSTLQSMGIENETYIFFTSDHGYHLGQFALVKGKSMPFESDIRVPFYVRGPNIPKNIRMKEMVANIDIAPTFLDIAGISTPRDMDGSSIMKLFRKSRDGQRLKKRLHVQWRDTILIEKSRGWRTTRKGENSRNKTAGSKEHKMLKLTMHGKSRNITVTTKERKITLLENICSGRKYQSPCEPKQLWECAIVEGRRRLRKCRKNGAVQGITTSTTRPTLLTAPTTPEKMCVCMKPRLGLDNQDDVFTYDEKWLKDELDYYSAKELRRRTRRSRFFNRNRARRKQYEFNARRYYKELARAQRLQNRRSKSKMLLSRTETGTRTTPNTAEANSDRFEDAGVQEVVEEKLGKLKEKIWETKMRLDALRDRKKKLLLISARDRLIEYPCPCYRGNSTRPYKTSLGSVLNGGKGHEGDNQEEGALEKGLELSPLKKRNRPPNAASRKAEPKKKKVKTSLRRTKCNSPGMSCFYQTNDHWRLPPLWTGGEFCFCPNAANNSYWCLRTINSTHNFLYCEFITQFLEFFDLNQDPYQLYNVIDQVEPTVLSQLHQQLKRLRGCQGEDCTYYYGKKCADVSTTTTPLRTPPSRIVWTGSSETIGGQTLTNSSENIVALSMKNDTAFRTTTSSHSDKLSSPLPMQNHSEQIEKPSGPYISTAERSIDVSPTTESSEGSSVTTMMSTEWKVQKENFMTSLLLPTKSIVPNKLSATPKTVPYSSSGTMKNDEKTEDVRMIPTAENTISPTNRSEDITTAFLKTSDREPSSLETTPSTTDAPVTLTTNGITVGEYSITKPARRKSARRRKNGEKHGKGISKKSKKLKKGKRKPSEKGISLVTSNIDSAGVTPQLSGNLTRIEKNSEKDKPGSGQPENNEEGNQRLTENSRKRNKKPSEKRLHRNSKKQAKRPTKLPTIPQISNEGAEEYETVSPSEGGYGFSPSDL